MRYFPWEQINELGRLKIFRLPIIIFVFLPIILKIIEKVPKTIEIPILNKVIIITIGLPFSWKVLYCSSLFFTFASMLYFIYCPKIIKRFQDYKGFKESGLTASFLHKELTKCINKKTKGNNTSDLVRFILKKNIHSLDKIRDKDEIENIIRYLDPILKSNSSEDTAAKSSFHFIYTASQYRHNIIRLATIASYTIGIILIVIIISQKVYYVLTNILQT